MREIRHAVIDIDSCLIVDQKHISAPFRVTTNPTITTAIVWLASAPSRLSASLRPREAGLTALTGPRASHAWAFT